MDDLSARVDNLKPAFTAPPDEMIAQDRAIVREALDIFGYALKRHRYLAEAERESLAHAA